MMRSSTPLWRQVSPNSIQAVLLMWSAFLLRRSSGKGPDWTGPLMIENAAVTARGPMFATAILVLWVTSALADPLTLRVVEASPAHTLHPSIFVRFDDEGRKAFAQFTTEHVGEDIEFLVAGKVLMKSRLQTPILGGALNIIGIFGANEIVDVANRLATEGRIEVNALGRPPP